MEEQANINVVVRVRPLLPKEVDKHGADVESLVVMPLEPKGSVLLKSPSAVKSYAFDDSVWSFDNHDNRFVNNRKFYQQTGPSLLEHCFQGFNVCLLAYGQTGSGKTFTMMGEDDDVGFVPLLVHDILAYKNRLVDDKVNCEVRLSYMEVYNETVRDLLYQEKEPRKWKVREHPETGPYVDCLKEYEINDYEAFCNLLNIGNRNRVTATTAMNSSSSRSHAILNLVLRQTRFDGEDAEIGSAENEVVSNIKLVDLAGSERLTKTQVYGQQHRVKEGSLINKSLTVLGRCINVLSKNTITNSSDLVPYRDSVLTYLLKENLGGNSKTMMIFCISPLDFEETQQTLNYATRVKNIKTIAKTNQKKLVKINMDWVPGGADNSVIENLREEIEQLSAELKHSNPGRLTAMVSYLEKELKTCKFENKFMSHRMKHLEAELEEVNNHNHYMNRSLRENIENQHKEQTKIISESVSYLQLELERHHHEISAFLQDAHPSTLV
ncbi:hypothetical protein PSN45_005044 [Yamadazyma tenuis]|uniref:Kinesin motor domain-containing protein n=1 Tax=Candida tenuis (strain ATCC 10573 / BCRC 21748 / CBS 615 / JCM 9827 / NBRC 10315 / NRRL Y-1498 / VKM Y-70) TaxID=590646 RepID=G3B2L0_CANTC|nr:uncharacterized protein CANTEDRAFT_120575 [Yamadazyma tenuis ATCC 10573]EGV64704.1 hypothetical protein CANTEDRAFT_120575 [Yamadazyma tenuis ATCC 10573]WEJ97491.1 hypothetical protein PSN45_005044 [Yamadazyma tenuis]